MSTDTECWTALKDYLTRQIEQDLAVHQAALADGDFVSANAHGTLVSANRSTLAKMRELETEMAAKADCKCAISGPGDVLPIACPVHGTPCEYCGGLTSCATDCGGGLTSD